MKYAGSDFKNDPQKFCASENYSCIGLLVRPLKKS